MILSETDDSEKSSEREANEFAYFLYHPDTIVEWWKPEDEILIGGKLTPRRYSKLEAKK